MKTLNVYLQYMNYENIVCNARLWKCPFETWIMKIGKYLFAINEVWKNVNVCLQNMNYEHLCLHYMNYENILFKYMNYEKIKMLFAMHELRYFLQYMNYENKKYFFAIHELWK